MSVCINFSVNDIQSQISGYKAPKIFTKKVLGIFFAGAQASNPSYSVAGC
jgi:hypothetical protein